MKTQIKHCAECSRKTVQTKTECLWCRKKKEDEMNKIEKKNPIEIRRWKVFCDLFYVDGARSQGMSLMAEANRIARKIRGCHERTIGILMSIAKRWADNKC